MLSINKKGVTEKLCELYCDGDSGKKIKGIKYWVLKRLETKKKQIDVTDDFENFEEYIKNEIPKILRAATPDELKSFETGFKKFEHLQVKIIGKDDKEKVSTLNRNQLLAQIFDYTLFRTNKQTIISGYWLADSLGIDCCPYCNRNYTTTHKQSYNFIKKKEKFVVPAFDHFLPQKDYPWLALSFYNLIPSCSICNSDYKLAQEEDILHPYENLKNNHFSFDFIPQDFGALVGKNKNIDIIINYKDKTVEDKLKKSIELFGIIENYKNHKDLISDIIDKKNTFSDRYLKDISSIYKLQFEETYKILFETHYEDDKLYKRPFSKLKKDIYDKLEEVKKKV